jgi:hypothetical protein
MYSPSQKVIREYIDIFATIYSIVLKVEKALGAGPGRFELPIHKTVVPVLVRS